jgi:GMP synthase PP-ATPase subunit
MTKSFAILKSFPEIGAHHDVRQFLEAVLWRLVQVHNGITAEGLRKL